MTPASREETARSVSEITRKIRGLIEGGIGEVWVEGEISNMRRQASGHRYFTLKDESAQLSCVLFAGAASGLGGMALEDGVQVEVFGGVSVYEPRGQYQLIVRKARLRGAGALQAKFEALKNKLAGEGLFDPAKKRPLPKFPSRVGLVTSPTGAAVHDFLDVLHRRYPGIEVILAPVRVQGRGAAGEIASAVREFSGAPGTGLPRVDVVVVTRGGGSLEDLWEFNEEEVARAVAACSVPVVSAVGHEIDFTICDFAADLRAPTPSAAAEILSADASEVAGKLGAERARMARACVSALQLASSRLAAISEARLLREPSRVVDRCRQSLDRGLNDLARPIAQRIESRRNRILAATSRLDPKNLLPVLAHARTKSGALLARLATRIGERRVEVGSRLGVSSAKLTALDPSATLARGYTITCGPDGIPLVSAKAAWESAELRTRFVDGEVCSTVQRGVATD